MTRHIPDHDTVRQFFIDGAEGEFIGEDFDAWLFNTALDAQLTAVRGCIDGLSTLKSDAQLGYIITNDPTAKLIWELITTTLNATCNVMELETLE